MHVPTEGSKNQEPSYQLRAVSTPIWAMFLLGFLTLVFWKLRIIDPATDERVTIPNMDLFISQYPMISYAINALKQGTLPLWNPYQLCGEPFLAIPYVGLFYPFNLVYLFFPIEYGIEASLVLHMIFGGLGMWWLVRQLGLTNLAALASALTFMWSGWMMNMTYQPQLFAGLAWAPFTLLFLEKILQGSRLARLGLILTITCQLLNGAVEFFLHTMYLGAIYVVFRLVQLGSQRAWADAIKAAGWIVGCISLGVLLSAAQLLPTIELVLQSARAPGELTFEATTRRGVVAPHVFLRSLYNMNGIGTVGVLPLLAIPLALGLRRYRLISLFCLTTGVAAVLLSFGGSFYRLYYELPVGSLFRRPMKFLDIYAFAQALLVAVAVGRLQTWTTWGCRRLWTQPAWLVTIALGAFLAIAPIWSIGLNTYLFAVTSLLLVFGSVSRPRPRVVALLIIVVLHGVSLFYGVENRMIRPSVQPEFISNSAKISHIEEIKKRLQHERVYLSPNLLMTKLGILNKVSVVGDYEPLAVGRYATFFDFVSPGRSPSKPFNGRYRLKPTARWRMMDLTSTKFYVVGSREPAAAYMRSAGKGFRPIMRGRLRVFERESPLPRAYFVQRARVLSDPALVLEALDDPGFNPREEVLLEREVPALAAGHPVGPATAKVKLERYEPERVVIDVDAPSPGFVVLTDLYYPGWKAFVDQREVPIYRANFLFRAIPVASGRATVTFEYKPASFRVGALITLVTAVVLAFWARGWRNHVRSKRAGPSQDAGAGGPAG